MPYADPEKAKECMRRYREKNREELRLKGREYSRKKYRENLAASRSKAKERYIKEREKIQERNKTEEFREKSREYHREYRKRNKNKIAAYPSNNTPRERSFKEQYLKNPSYYRERTRKYYERNQIDNPVVGTWSEEEIQVLVENQHLTSVQIAHLLSRKLESVIYKRSRLRKAGIIV